MQYLVKKSTVCGLQSAVCSLQMSDTGLALGEMFICSNSEMEVRPLIRIRKVIWDQLLASKAEIIQKEAFFRL